MKIFVSLRDTLFGHHAIIEHAWPYDDGEGVDYQYGLGNYSCDCNRSLFLYGALDIEDPYTDPQRPWRDAERPCSNSRPTIAIDAIRDEQGLLLYRDEP
jgi:hypothetical protein